MIILGLGSNIGDRLENLRKAFRAIQQIPALKVQQVSPIYISDAMMPENAPDDWDMPFLNLALRCDSSMPPIELLKQIKMIEQQIGRNPDAPHWAPRLIDIDILAYDELIVDSEELSIPHKHLLDRPFALWPLSDVAPLWTFPRMGTEHGKTAAHIVEPLGSRFLGEAAFHTRQIPHRIDMPQLVGIVNVTPDSFSDGGHFFSAEHAVQQALHLVASGAEVIDIGAEATSPNAAQIDPATEWQRLEPVLMAIKEAKTKFLIPPKISVDTRHAGVAKKVLNFGADWINDVTGLQDPAMREIIAQGASDCVVMHHVSIPASRLHVLPREKDAAQLVYEWGARQLDLLEKEGIARGRVIFDPGIGFGKTAENSYLLVKNTPVFEKLGTRLLIGHSRKLFISLLSPVLASERDIETTTISLALAKYAVDYLRVHNVDMCARAFRVMAAL